MCAHVRGDSLWTVHHIAVNEDGNSGIVLPSPDRNGCRWYELDVTGNVLAPAPVQVGTLLIQQYMRVFIGCHQFSHQDKVT